MECLPLGLAPDLEHGQEIGIISLDPQLVGDAQAVPPAVAEFRQHLLAQGEAAPGSLERFAFYEQARTARLVVQTGDLRKYANILLRKGVISTD